MSQTMILRNVKAVRITEAADINDQQTREIEIDLHDGTSITIELWTTHETLKLEIL